MPYNIDKLMIKKILTLVSLICIAIVLLIIARTPAATNYEISIYKMYPYYFWIIFVVPIIISFLLIAFFSREENENYLKICLIIDLCDMLVILSMPAFRGYISYGGGDTLTHLSLIKEILNTGKIGGVNPYPISHIIMSSLSLILNSSPENISLFIPQIFFVLYVSTLYVFAKSIAYEKPVYYMITLLGIIPALGFWLTVEYIMPSTEAFMMMPLILYLLFIKKTNKFPYSILLIIILILMAFYHPETMIFLLIILLLNYFLVNEIRIISNNTNNYCVQRESILPVLIMVIACFSWAALTIAFKGTVKDLYNIFILNIKPPEIPALTTLGNVKISIYEIIKLIINEYGAALLYIGIGIVVSIKTIIARIKRKEETKKLDFFLSLTLVIFIFINIIFLYKGSQIGIQVFRQLKYSIFISTIIVGTYLGTLFLGKTKNRFSICKKICIAVIMIFIIYNSIFSVFSSPAIHIFNYQNTKSDIAGMSFFFSYRDESKQIIEAGVRSYQTRYGQYLMGAEKILPNVRDGYDQEVQPPPHFGYSENTLLGEYYKNNIYMLSYPPAENYYPSIYPGNESLWVFTPNDYAKLNLDPTVDILYDNNSVKIYTVSGRV
jgi:hypothetical protein